MSRGIMLSNSRITVLVDGLMSISNCTLAFFKDTCNRNDIAIQVSQNNDDGQFPITTSLISVCNTSRENLIFNGEPNLRVVNPSDCVGKFT